jgi:clathrin heavy chain
MLTYRQTLESDHYVCVRQQADEGAPAETVILDLKNTNNVIRRPIRADSAIMHLTEPIIALRAQSRTLQLFNLQTKERLQTYTHSEDIVFWRWISQSTLALVSTNSVFHWDVIGTQAATPVKVFDRQEQLAVRVECHCRQSAANPTTEQPDHQLCRQR